MDDIKTSPATLEEAIQSLDALATADELKLQNYATAQIKTVKTKGMESFKKLPLMMGAFSLSAAATYFLIKKIQNKHAPLKVLRWRRTSTARPTP